MAAKKKAAKKKKATGPDLSNRVLEFGDLSKKEQSDAVGLESRLSETMPEQMSELAAKSAKSSTKAERAKAKRYSEAAPKMERKSLTMEGMVKARKEAFATATSGDLRLPTEDVAGQEFYFKNRKNIDETVGSTGIPVARAVDATGRLSVRTTPENEKASLKALSEAHQKGSVNMGDAVVSALRSTGADVPEDLVGKQVPFKDVPGPLVRALADPAIRETARGGVSDVDIDSMSRTSMRNNLQYAHEALQGKRDVVPTKNPKLYAYARSHELAEPDSPVHREYQLRAGHIGKTMRGEIAGSQLMFDFEGLRESNEGALSDRLQTANDSWMLANQRQQPQAVRKVSGEVQLSAKSGTTKRGRALSVGKGISQIKPAGIQHAVGAEATSRAARELREEHNFDFPVPAMLVQEGVWAVERRQVRGDSDFTAATKPVKEPRMKKQGTQLSLFKD